MLRTTILFCVVAFLFGTVAVAAGSRDPGKKSKLDTLAVHRTIARFEGAPYRLCRGLTAFCPDRCGHSGEITPGLISPVRPVVELRKISQQEADRLRAGATKKPAAGAREKKAESRSGRPAPRGAVHLALVSAAAPKKKATAAEAEAAAKKWLDSLGDKGLILVEKADEKGFVGEKVIGRSSTIFNYQKTGWWVSLGFSDVIEADTPLDVVRKRLKYVALDRLPTPGLDVPGWEIRPRTPVSSFRDGVEIVDFRDGRIRVRVKSGFFALYGRDPSVLVPADAPSPKSAYFMIRQKFPLDLTIEAPLAMK